MSRRLWAKRNAAANRIQAAMRERTGEGWPGMACSYGAHDWRYQLDATPPFKTCAACEGVYTVGHAEAEAIREAHARAAAAATTAVEVALADAVEPKPGTPVTARPGGPRIGTVTGSHAGPDGTMVEMNIDGGYSHILHNIHADRYSIAADYLRAERYP